MTAPPVTDETAILAARAAQERAQAAFERCPSGENLQEIENCTAVMDARLERWAKTHGA